MTVSNNTTAGKRLAKNSIYMYVRMFLLTIISLYTSRVILEQLGVEDYGIYNVVGSIVVMFNSLKSIFASSTQRFLNYEMGLGNNDRLQLIYNMSTFINLFIALMLVILVEGVGLWFLDYKINLPPDRLLAAKIVFQFSVLSTVISLMTTPLNACIIAHERMGFYAYLSILEAGMKLGICYLLSMFDIDKLIFYGFLVLLVHIIVYLINLGFCKKNFSECYISKSWDKQYFLKMTQFAGWAFFGNTSFALTNSGINMVLNMFGGPVVNAARGIAYQVSAALHGFISNIVIVIKPYAIKTYASGNIGQTLKLVHISSKIYFIIQLMILIIFSFLASDIIKLWLGIIPEYSVLFLILVLTHSLVKSLHSPIDMLFAAEGDIKYYQLYEGIVLALPIPLSYMLLKFGFSYYTSFLTIIACEILHILGIMILASKICNLKITSYLRSVITPCLICYIVYFCFYSYYYYNISQFSIGQIILYTVLVCFICLLLMTLIGFGRYERNMILSIIKKK